MKFQITYKIIIILLINSLMAIAYFWDINKEISHAILRLSELELVGILSLFGAFFRWKFLKRFDTMTKSYYDYYLSTNFLINAQLGVIIVGIPIFVIWVFVK